MQAVRLHSHGEPAQVLRVEDVPEPTADGSQVRVRMLASPVNPSDLMMVRGVYARLPQLPAVPGFEGVGVVEGGGGLYGKYLQGKRVAVLASEVGKWQQFVAAPARQCVPLSDDLSLEQAAMFFVNPATAYVMTRQVLAPPAGAWLLQTAANSALGRMVVRLGREYGFRTINVVRRSEQVAGLKELGADEVIATDREDLAAQIDRITEGRGVRFALDPVGGELGSTVAGHLAEGGRLLVYGTLSGEPLSLSPRELMTPGAAVEGFWLARHMEALGLVGKLKLVRKVSALIRSGVLTAEVAQTFPLSQVQEAVQASEAPGKDGKILLKIADG